EGNIAAVEMAPPGPFSPGAGGRAGFGKVLIHARRGFSESGANEIRASKSEYGVTGGAIVRLDQYSSVDYLVIGAGPAGLQLGYFLEQAGRNYLILEAGDSPGSFFRTFPRHRRLISINKPHTGWDDPELNM